MRTTRKIVVLTLVALLAMGIAATTASAAPPAYANQYGLKYAGKAVCIECHGTTYNATAHGGFASAAPTIAPGPATGMWPAGKLGVGTTVPFGELAYELGAGSPGGREYLRWNPGNAFSADGPFQLVNGLTWFKDVPNKGEDSFEYTSSGLVLGNYTCGRCHQMGWQTKNTTPVFGHGSGTATFTAWAISPTASRADSSAWVPTASIQCEICHGMGLPGDSTTGHWNSGVKVVGGWTVQPSLGKISSQNILDSSVCGQCHGTYVSGAPNTNGGAPYGYTADTSLTAYVQPYGFNAVPTDASFTADPSPYKFYPNGEDYALRHSYYSEWTLSGHSLRSALATNSPGVSQFQMAGNYHYSPTGRQDTCNKCHTGEGYLKRKGASIMNDFTPSSSNEGFFGQECVICHQPHKPTGGMDVREPDTAGEGSCAGLSRSNTNICQDCHNWQAEVLGTPVVPSTSSRAVSHPQREMVWGKGMFDVPEATEFMPGAQCNQCHMPATYSETSDTVGVPRYVDQSVKRYTHRMFPMLPGDAQRWNLGPSGDSCSPCHVSTSQEDLQARIDEWQTEAGNLNTEALNAYTAALSRPNTSTAANQQLLGRANVNRQMFLQDSSLGVHNPPYEQAGLMKATFLANSVGGDIEGEELLYPAQIAQGAPAAITGNIDFGDDTNAVGATVALDRQNGSTWTEIAYTTADQNGNVAYIIGPTATATYRLRWERSANPITDLPSDSFTIQVIQPSSQVTIAASPTTIKLGKTFNLSGGVLPADPGSVVKIQVRKGSSGTWGFLGGGSMTLSSFSTYSKSVKPSSKASWYYKVRYYGTDTTPGSTSGVVKVVVN